MKTSVIRRSALVAVSAACGAAAVAFAQPNPAAPGGAAPAAAGQLQTLEQKMSYGLGLNVGRSLKQDGLNPDPTLFARGLKDAMTEAEPLLTDEQLTEVFTQMQQQLQEKQMAAQKEQATVGQQFLEKNKAREGVKVTQSGLQYEVLKQGQGPKPKETDTVKVHYHGTLPDGTVFDSSVDRGQPAEFPLNRVIKGWTEGVQLMPVGSKYKFYVPADLAYGDRGAPPRIGPNQPLVFEVELLEIKN